MQENTLDTSQCDSEPIRFINSIQDFGALLVIDELGNVRGYSENFKEFTGCDAAALINSPIKNIKIDNTKYHVDETQVGKLKIFQFEKIFEDRTHKLNSYLQTLQSSLTLKNLLEQCADVIAEVSGFDRVMVYKFHEDFHGEVVAEKVNEGVDSFFGLHYPASDIPTPARAIFLENWIRMIPNVAYRPVGIISNLPDVIDLGTVMLRAVSPIHIQYLKNMEVGATLTISLIVNNKLWGLIACHNRTPKMVSKTLRDKCEAIGRFTSSLVNVVILQEKNFHSDKIKQVHKNLRSRLERTDDMARELSEHSPTLLDLIEAEGASAALYVDGYWASLGKTPTESQLNSLVDWLSVSHKDKAIFETNELSEHFEEAHEYKNICSGLLAVSVPKTNRNYILWFRPEVIQTVIWAGNPDKSVSQVNGRLSPRASFQEWKSLVLGKSLPWLTWEVDAALELRNVILATDLKRQFDKEQKARAEAVMAIEAREDLMAVVSHDLKNPLNSIQMNTQLLKRYVGQDDKSSILVERILRSSTTMNNLINDILSIAKLEAGQFEISKSLAPIRLAIRESLDMLLPLATEKGIVLSEIKNEFECNVHYDFDRMLQVLSNLIGNAIKFTPSNGKISVEIEKCGPTFVKIKISDNGPGIPQKHLNNVFDRFWQANQAKRLGTGLGLSIAKEIVNAHGGEIWVESKGEGEGATFQFTLPL